MTRTGDGKKEDEPTSCKDTAEALLSIRLVANEASGSPANCSPCSPAWLIPASTRNGIPSGDFRVGLDETADGFIAFLAVTFMRLEVRRADMGTGGGGMSIDVAGLLCLVGLCGPVCEVG